MVFRANQLRDAFEGQGEAGFMVYSYACFDPFEEVLAPGYFPALNRLKMGDLVYLGISQRPAKAIWQTQQLATETRRAHSLGAYRPVGLLEAAMVAGRHEQGRLRMRLVQDFGRPEDPDAAITEVKRPRGRPAKAA